MARNSYSVEVENQKNILEGGLIDEPSRADIKRGMSTVAQLIQRYGPKYWPVLERLKQECDAVDDRQNLLASLLADATVWEING